jgi:hypothetical protein
MIAGRVPFPVDDGWKMRTFNILNCLVRQGVKVDFIAFGEAADEPAYHDLRILCDRFEVVPRRKSYAFSDLLKGVVFSTPFPVLNYYDAVFARRLDELTAARRYDFVQVEDIVLCPATDCPGEVSRYAQR